MLLYQEVLQHVTPKKEDFLLHNLNIMITLKKFDNTMILFNI